MIMSVFESLEDVRPAKRYNKKVESRIAILERNIKELENYFPRCGREKKSILQKLICRYTILLNKLQKI